MFPRSVSLGVSFSACAGLLLLAGCGTSAINQPLNKPLDGALSFSSANRTGGPSGVAPTSDTAFVDLAQNTTLSQDGLLVGLSFSGGGTRAAAFGYGLAKEIEATQIHVGGKTDSLFDHVDILSGVSGGSVLAAYAGLRGREGLGDFRERFLLRDAEASLNLSVGLSTVTSALKGGINDQSKLPKWLDDNLFDGATLRDLERSKPAHVHIYASDLYNRHSFIFSRSTFDAICSDFNSYPLSHAVAASAAVPIVFSPIVLETFPDRCKTPLPAWVDRVVNDKRQSEMVRSAARGLKRNRDPSEVRYIKLVDGGLSDNFGVTAIIVERAKENTPYGPLTPQQAVKLSRALFLVANAGPSPAAAWARTIEGPAGIDMVNAISDTAIRANVRANFDELRGTLNTWRDQLVRWRCSLPSARVQQLRGTLAGWNCRDVQFFADEIGFDDLGPVRERQLSAIETRFKLPEDQVDTLIAAGREGLRTSDIFRRFLASLPGGRTAPRVAAADAR